MNLGLVVGQLRQYCPSLSNNVVIAVDFEKAIEKTVNMDDPFACVIPLEEEATESSPAVAGTLRQFVKERIGIIVSENASADRRGQTAALTLNDMKYELFSAILNWNPDPTRGTRGFQYAGGHFVHFDRERLFWQFEFEWTSTITDEDGFQPDAVPISKITMVFGIGGSVDVDTITAEVIFIDAAASATAPKPNAMCSMTTS